MGRVGEILAGVFGVLWVATLILGAAVVRTIWLRELAAAERHAEERHAWVKEAHEREQSAIGALHEFYRKALEQVTNSLNYGSPVKPEAVTTEPKDAELDLRAAIAESTIVNGMNALRREYEAIGMHPTDDDLREEVTSLMAEAMPERALLVRDR